MSGKSYVQLEMFPEMAEHERRRLEEVQDAASDLEKKLPKGFRVVGGRHYKGYGLTLHIPPELRGGKAE